MTQQIKVLELADFKVGEIYACHTEGLSVITNTPFSYDFELEIVSITPKRLMVRKAGTQNNAYPIGVKKFISLFKK